MYIYLWINIFRHWKKKKRTKILSNVNRPYILSTFDFVEENNGTSFFHRNKLWTFEWYTK